MKKIILTFILINSYFVWSQDTVFVSTKNTSYITFPEDISYFDIGMPDYFVADIGQGMSAQNDLKENFDGKMLKLKALKSSDEASTLMIKFGDRYEMVYLKYKEKPKKLFHKMFVDLNISNQTQISQVKPTAIKTNTNSVVTVNSNSVTSKERLRVLCDSVLKMGNELKEYGFIDTYLQAGVTVIRNDNNNTYLKIAIQNRSSIPYKFDFISFQYVQKMNKGFIKTKKKAPQDVFPTCSPLINDIPANQGKYVSYAVPTFGLANNGYLLILFREKNGDRVLKIYIPSNVIQGSGYIK